MSFDKTNLFKLAHLQVSIPLEQGNVFRQREFLIGLQERVSIPLEQGNVFRQWAVRQSERWNNGLNPFGTGQCLSTAVGC